MNERLKTYKDGLIDEELTQGTIKTYLREAERLESFLKDKGLVFKTIPTPREITKSCGLAILFNLDDLHLVEDVIEEEIIRIEALYRYSKSRKSNHAEKIL